MTEIPPKPKKIDQNTPKPIKMTKILLNLKNDQIPPQNLLDNWVDLGLPIITGLGWVGLDLG